MWKAVKHKLIVSLNLVNTKIIVYNKKSIKLGCLIYFFSNKNIYTQAFKKTQDKMKEIEEIKKYFKDINIEINDDSIHIVHPDNSDVLKIFEKNIDNAEISYDYNMIREFVYTKYITGRFLFKKNYFEAVIDFSNIFDYHDEESTTIKPTGKEYEKKCHYETGKVSEEFEHFLNESIHWDHFSAEFFHSIKIYNIDEIFNIKYTDEKYLQNVLEICSQLFFNLSTKYGINIKLLDLSQDESFDPEIEEINTNTIKSTIIESYVYDSDLVSYYNRAIHLPKSSFKYLAFFQVLECIFDEVYLSETIQDTRAILNSDSFHPNNTENIHSLIKIIERFGKEQNDRTKIRLILEKYFKMNLHDDAYLLAYSNISSILIDLKYINNESDMKDLQKLGNIVYDIRNEYTHSNRKFPKKKENTVEIDKLDEQIELIRLISKTIIINYIKP